MSVTPEYLVTIVGYEGLEQIFGPFLHEEAFELFMTLKRLADERLEEGYGDVYEYNPDNDPAVVQGHTPGLYCRFCHIDYYRDDREYSITEGFGINSLPDSSDRVCIQKPYGPYKNIICACADFPDRPKLEKMVLY